VVYFVVSMWPLVFNDAPPGDEEVDEAIMTMFLGFLVFGWGCFICFGASQLSELGNYTFALAGAILAVPMLVGIYGIVMMMDPKVKEGFAETEGGPDDEDDLDNDKDDDDDDDDDEDDDDDDELIERLSDCTRHCSSCSSASWRPPKGTGWLAVPR